MEGLPDLSAPLTDTSVNGTSIESKLLKLIADVDLAAEAAIAKKLVDGVAATTYGFSPDEVPTIANLVANEGKAVTTFGTGLSAIQNELFSGVTMSAEIAEYRNQPWLIGGYPLANYVKLSGGLCCASTGINLMGLMEVNQTPIMTSKALIKAMIAEYPTLAGNFVTMPFFLSYDRGSIQLLNFYTFAGGFAGFITQSENVTFENMKSAIIYGSNLASFCVEKFGTERMVGLKSDEVNARLQQFKSLTQFDIEIQ